MQLWAVAKFPRNDIQIPQPVFLEQELRVLTKHPSQPHVHPEGPDLGISLAGVNPGFPTFAAKYSQRGTVYWQYTPGLPGQAFRGNCEI